MSGMRTRCADIVLLWAQVDKKPAVEGAGVSRRPSKRQQEKAPEGRPPRESNEEEVAREVEGEPAQGESRFREEL